MSISHDNPTRPRVDRTGREAWARAPYNFVPLPDQVVEANQPLEHDSYHENALTGWIDCELETCSPTYVRGMLPEDEFIEFGQKNNEDLTSKERDQKAVFFSTGETLVEGKPAPRIPGSTLRGMVHQLVEVLGYGRMRWVAKEPVFSFRAVAAPRNDPLSEPYRAVIGPLARNVRAGYLHRNPISGAWSVRPAKTPRSLGLPDEQAFLKVKEHQIGSKDLPGYIRLNSSGYHPQLHWVSVDVEERTSRNGRYSSINRIGASAAGYRYQGVLVCSGNMNESSKEKDSSKRKPSPRKSHTLVMEEDPNQAMLSVSDQVIRDYINGLTPYQQDEVSLAWGVDKSGRRGCVAEGKPIFYVADGKNVSCFGHSPNFRIPARQRFGSVERAATPHDFIPDEIRGSEEDGKVKPDFTDALFGWVKDDASPQEPFAGRVFFSDASYRDSSQGVWYRPEPITPRTLSGPKPTTFQHYLVQSRPAGHNPDQRVELAHYGTPTTQTNIRGHKFYWTKGSSPSIEATSKDLEHEKQLTRILPVKAGVRFIFRVRFENLRPEELGALYWALALPARGTPRHRLGMGKPLGMGVVAIRPSLVLTDRKARYSTLFRDGAWHEAAQPASAEVYTQAFERVVLNAIAPEKEHLEDVARIGELLTMLEWREGTPQWLDWTRYMEIERDPGAVNEYKERPVLPTPSGVITLAAGKIPVADTQPRPIQNDARQSATRTEREVGFYAPREERRTPPARIEPAKPAELKPGSRVRASIYSIETNGDLFLELADFSSDDVLGHVRASFLAGKKYKEGDQASFEVIEIRTEGKSKLVECKLALVGAGQPDLKTGTVKNFGLGAAQSYGFITPDDGGEDLFVHKSDLSADLETLTAGQKVTYKLGRNPKGKWVAKEVHLG